MEGEFEVEVGALLSAEESLQINADRTGVPFAVGSQVFVVQGGADGVGCTAEGQREASAVGAVASESVSTAVSSREAGSLGESPTDSSTELEELRLKYRFSPKASVQSLCWHTFVRAEDGVADSYSSW